VGAGLGAMAQLSGAPVLPVFLSRNGWRNQRWDCGTAFRIQPDQPRDQERLRILAECLDWLGTRVMADPQQYFWYNKRWVLEPLENPAPTSAQSAPPPPT